MSRQYADDFEFQELFSLTREQTQNLDDDELRKLDGRICERMRECEPYHQAKEQLINFLISLDNDLESTKTIIFDKDNLNFWLVQAGGPGHWKDEHGSTGTPLYYISDDDQDVIMDIQATAYKGRTAKQSVSYLRLLGNEQYEVSQTVVAIWDRTEMVVACPINQFIELVRKINEKAGNIGIVDDTLANRGAARSGRRLERKAGNASEPHDRRVQQLRRDKR